MASTVPLLDNYDTLGFGEENEPKGRLMHPIVTSLHLFFRLGAIITYQLCGWFSASFITSFVVVVLLLAMDFWTVKNITGRIMVGLRWWNYIDDQGDSHWVYEAKKGDLQGRVSPLEVRIFWSALVVAPVLWSLFLLIALFSFSFKWFMLVGIALSLSASNLYGYIRCKMGKSDSVTQSLKGMASGLVQKQMLNNVVNMFSRAPPTTTPNTTV